MFSLFKKEINNFFASLTGYLVIIIFLFANGLFLWVFHGEFNIFDFQIASLEPLFVLSPLIFLFLVPAVTMRMFAEEKRSGTIELLLTRPLTRWQIIIAKYFAAVILVIFALIPTFVYFFSVNYLGNIDVGGTFGSYIGLFFLAAIYAAIGIFASSLTDNQIIAFILGMVLSFFFYLGFESVGMLGIKGNIAEFLVDCGINEHYKSMSRGVIDSRDVIYFVGVIFLFNLLTHFVLENRKWK